MVLQVDAYKDRFLKKFMDSNYAVLVMQSMLSP
jgi:hypothetical protein